MCRLLQHKTRNLKGLEAAISHGLTSVVDLEWPSARWPIHVFTAGAMVCLATSTFCHLFSASGHKIAKVSPPLPMQYARHFLHPLLLGPC